MFSNFWKFVRAAVGFSPELQKLEGGVSSFGQQSEFGEMPFLLMVHEIKPPPHRPLNHPHSPNPGKITCIIYTHCYSDYLASSNLCRFFRLKGSTKWLGKNNRKSSRNRKFWGRKIQYWAYFQTLKKIVIVLWFLTTLKLKWNSNGISTKTRKFSLEP